MQTGILDNYNVPEVAREAFRTGAYAPRQLEDGVQMYSGHDRGVAYRFFNHYEYNKAKSKILKKESYDHFEAIEWLVTEDHKPVERIKFLGDALLELDDEGNAIGGQFAEAYRRWKEGLSAPGTPISRWGCELLHDGHIQTLAANGIFSVEQLASTSRERIRTKFGKEFEQLLDRAIEHANAKVSRDESDRTATEMLRLQQENSKMADRVAAQEAQMEQMREQMAALLNGGEAPKARRGRKPKIVAED